MQAANFSDLLTGELFVWNPDGTFTPFGKVSDIPEITFSNEDEDDKDEPYASLYSAIDDFTFAADIRYFHSKFLKKLMFNWAAKGPIRWRNINKAAKRKVYKWK